MLSFHRKLGVVEVTDDKNTSNKNTREKPDAFTQEQIPQRGPKDRNQQG